MKFNVEFTRQAVNFSILLFTLLLIARARRVNFVPSKDARKQLARTSLRSSLGLVPVLHIVECIAIYILNAVSSASSLFFQGIGGIERG